MNLWVFNHYADSPEGSATRTFDLCRALVEKGHEATIFASSFSHHRLREEHFNGGARLSRSEQRDGVRLIWLRGIPYRANDWRRIVNMVGYGALALSLGAVTGPKPDVVIGCSVHPCAALAGLTVARLNGARFFVEVPDLWPQVLIDFGRIRAESAQAAILRWIESLLFASSERIIMLWRNTDAYLRERDLPLEKIVWIPHVVDPGSYAGLPDRECGGRPFIAMYLGSFVQSTALDVVLEAASMLEAAGRQDIHIVLIGGGVEKERLVARARGLGLANLAIRDPVAKSLVPATLSMADCLICSFKRSPVYQYGVSMNKLCDYLMSGRPVILSGESAYDPVAEGGAGYSVPAEDPRALAEALVTMADLPPEQRRAMGQRGIAWVKRHHDVRLLADRLEGILLPRSEPEGALT